MIHPLPVMLVSNMGAVASLGISKLLDRGVNNWRKEDGLYVDKDMLKVQSCKPASKVLLSVLCNDHR